jgi:hypothetical protein
MASPSLSALGPDSVGGYLFVFCHPVWTIKLRLFKVHLTSPISRANPSLGSCISHMERALQAPAAHPVSLSDDEFWDQFGKSVFQSLSSGALPASGGSAGSTSAASSYPQPVGFGAGVGCRLMQLGYLKVRCHRILATKISAPEDALLGAHIRRNKDNVLRHVTVMSGLDKPWNLALKAHGAYNNISTTTHSGPQ